MIELFRQFERESGIDVYGLGKDRAKWEAALEKFGEMITIECLQKIDGLIVPETFEQDIGPYEKWNQALGHAALEIEQHFFGDAHE